MSRPTDISNQRFGRLLATNPTDRRVSGKVIWRCVCDCGTETFSYVSALIDGRRVSCGCAKVKGQQIRKKAPRHGHWVGDKATPTYGAWNAMISRCFNPNVPGYKHYGGRGIAVCERWRDFKNFLADIGEKPAGRSLDRINNDGNYEPGNVRWATAIEQARNKRSNRFLTHDGRTATVAEWGEITGIDRHVIGDRIVKSGWSTKGALTTPLRTPQEAAALMNKIRWGHL